MYLPLIRFSGQSATGCFFSVCLALLLMFSGGCVKEDFDFSKFAGPDLDPELAVPLVHSKLGISRLLPAGSLIVEDSNHLLTLVYQKEVLSLRAEDYINISDQHADWVKDNIELVVLPGMEVTLPFNETLVFFPPQSGQRIDSMVVKSALVHVNFSSDINHEGSLRVVLPTVKKDGQVFEALLGHHYTGSLPVTGQNQLDLSGYHISFVNAGGQIELPVYFELFIAGDNNPNLSPYTFSLDIDISGFRFTAVYGYLGQFEYPFSDSITLNIFKNNLQGKLHFSDLKLMVSTSNSVGMPMELAVNEIKAWSDRIPPAMVNLIDNPAFPNPLVFPSPDISEAGSTADTTYIFTPVNCNLNQALDISPQYLSFSLLGKSNPDGNPAAQNFILDTSRFSVNVRLELPFFGSVEGFNFEDTLDFNFRDIDQVQEFAFRMVTVNRFPLDIRVQAYFADSSLQILDSLVYENDPHLVHAAPVGGPPDYRIVDDPPVQAYTYLPQPLTRERLQRLSTCKKMILRAGLNTTGQGLVKIYGDYDLDIRMGAKVRFTYSTSSP
ncbi:MAG TPA: hypothetical protein P5531_01335 [Bacteroidales bacterium]|nr:hypothetical protein [Bacteroidales bacterium]HSA42297.1 hypothetical protein [Bacteroidales bacterium]